MKISQISVRNVNSALVLGLAELLSEGRERSSRAGQVLSLPGPMCTVFKSPTERVLLAPERDANPFFHLMEGLWMLAGRNDAAYVAQYVSRMRAFSDDGLTLRGAYGHRWLRHFGFNQLNAVAKELTDNPDSRRAVLGMWDPIMDLGGSGKDLPCNTHAYFGLDEGKLNMTVCCRSNDAIWGAYGANAVHFSMLQEYLAHRLGVEVGWYTQFSNNFHAYLDVLEPLRDWVAKRSRRINEDAYATGADIQDPYVNLFIGEMVPLINVSLHIWHEDLDMFLSGSGVIGYRDRFFRRVAVPMANAHKAFREGKGEDKFLVPMEILEQVVSPDWRLAAQAWITRRHDKWLGLVSEGDQNG